MKYTLTGLMILLCAMAQAQMVQNQAVAVPPGTTAVKATKHGLVWHYGLKADLDLTNVVGTGMKSTFVAGGEIGGFASVELNKKWGLQGEVLVAQEASKRGYDFNTYFNANGNAFSHEDIKLTYLHIPVLARYFVLPQLSLVAGPQVSFLLNDDEDLLQYNQRAFKTYSISGNLGAEFNIHNVALYGRYNLDLSNINDADGGYPVHYRWAAQHIMLGIAVGFK